MALAWLLVLCMLAGLFGLAFLLGRWSAVTDLTYEIQQLRRVLVERERSEA